MQWFPICILNHNWSAGEISDNRWWGSLSYPGIVAAIDVKKIIERSQFVVVWESHDLMEHPQNKNWIFALTVSIPFLTQCSIVTTIFWQSSGLSPTRSHSNTIKLVINQWKIQNAILVVWRTQKINKSFLIFLVKMLWFKVWKWIVV